MKRFPYLPVLLLIFSVLIFFRPVFLQQKLPIPADTIIGLYHPFRDLYANQYPNGIPYKNFLVTDPVRQQYPWRSLSIDSIKEGVLPQWNPYAMAGTPLLANFQSAVFYPLNLLFFVFPFSISWSILVILQPLLASVFLYIYLRHLRLAHAAAYLGGIVFAFCGFAIAWFEWNTLLHSTLWLPLLLLAIDKLFHRKDVTVWSLVLGFALTASFFAGHLQIFFYLFLVSLCYFFARWWQHGKNVRHLFVFLVIIACFLLVTAIQWIPAIQFINLSARGVDQVNGWQQPGWFIPWQHLVQFLAPDFFGNPTTLNYWGEWNYGEFVGYIGIFPLIMAVFAMFARHDKKTRFFTVFFVLSLLFALPTIFAQLPYIWNLPFFATSQPTRLLFVADFSLAILAALGLDFLIKTSKKTAVLFAVSFVGIILGGLWLYVLFGSNLTPSVIPEYIAVAKRNLYIPTFFFITVFALLGVWILITSVKRFHKMLNVNMLRILLVIFLLALTTFDLLRFFEKFTPFSSQTYLFPSTKALAYLQKQDGEFRIMSTDSRILPPNFSVIYKLQSLDGYDPLYLQRYGEFMAALKRDKPDIQSPFGFNRIITQQAYESRLIDMLGVRYVLSLTELDSPKLKEVYSEGQTRVYQNNQAFPRTFFIERIDAVSQKEEAIQKLFDKSIDLRKTAVVEVPGDFAKSKSIATGSANVLIYDENRIKIQTNNTAEGFLVLMDSYYPTWHAKVCDTKESACTNVQLFITNYAFRGLFVPAGEHHIIFYNSLL